MELTLGYKHGSGGCNRLVLFVVLRSHLIGALGAAAQVAGAVGVARLSVAGVAFSVLALPPRRQRRVHGLHLVSGCLWSLRRDTPTRRNTSILLETEMVSLTLPYDFCY